METEKSSKRKDRYSSSSLSSQESSPVDKRPKNVSFSGDSDDEVMVALNLLEGLSKKVDLILLKLDKLVDLLEQKMNEVSTAVAALELSEDNIKEIEKNLEFTSGRRDDFEKALAEKNKNCE